MGLTSATTGAMKPMIASTSSGGREPRPLLSWGGIASRGFFEGRDEKMPRKHEQRDAAGLAGGAVAPWRRRRWDKSSALVPALKSGNCFSWCALALASVQGTSGAHSIVSVRPLSSEGKPTRCPLSLDNKRGGSTGSISDRGAWGAWDEGEGRLEGNGPHQREIENTLAHACGHCTVCA